MWRLAYVSPGWISQFSVKALHDERISGMSKHGFHHSMDRYGISVNTDRLELQWKNGLVLDEEHNTSIALMTNFSVHDASYEFGKSLYDVNQKNAYAQLMYETDFSPSHNLSLGLSLHHDNYGQKLQLSQSLQGEEQYLLGVPVETVSGVYAQYTFSAGSRLTVMPGIRWDYSSEYHGFFTPRVHVKFAPSSLLTLRLSAGKGYRSPHAMAENVSLLASGKAFIAPEKLKQEEAWNTGVSAAWVIPVAGKNLELNLDYYYTHFIEQMIINPDGQKGINTFCIENQSGKSYSHTLQIDATYPFFKGFTATGAYRLTESKATYDNVLRTRPLTSRYKGLLTVGYKTPLEIWHFDVTGSVNGPGYLYDRSRYPAYFQLQAQVTREFRLFSVYVGGENLTNYTIDHPIRNASQPWSAHFDTTQVWGPTDGAMFYIGMRFKLQKM